VAPQISVARRGKYVMDGHENELVLS